MPTGGLRSIPKRVIASYLLDCAIVAIGAGLWNVTPYHRPFTLTDPSISFPHTQGTISTGVLFVVSVIAPLIITFVVVIVLPPKDPTFNSQTNKSLIWRRKLWEWHTAWLGLCLSFALSLFFVQALKNLFGRPRPDLLSRCDPDWENQANYAIGGFPQVLNGFYLVSSTICRQTDQAVLNDGFSSFPSGHATYSWAGMGYLALFLCAKFGFTVPYLPMISSSSSSTAKPSPPALSTANGRTLPHTPSSPPSPAPRSSTAAPPLLLFLLPFIPICVAIYITATRFHDFRHHPGDIIFGSLLGLGLSLFTFRLYHLPVRRGGGASWRARSVEGAFGLGDDRKKSDDSITGDVEMGNMSREGQDGKVDEGASSGLNGHR
ncbi:MAG: hypothetical protein Q9208_001119 [Pyrenodesmia sp. 3 TL-2023]